MRSVRSPQSTLGYVIGMQFKGFVIVTAEDDRRVNYSLNRTLFEKPPPGSRLSAGNNLFYS